MSLIISPTGGAESGTNGDITSLQSARQVYPSVNAAAAFGDSITFGALATSTALSYRGRIETATGWTLANQGLGGREFGQILTEAIYPTTTALNDAYTLLPGFNDFRRNGTAALGLGTFRRGLTAALLWLAIPHDQKITAQSARVSAAGTWANAALYGTTLGKSSSTQTSTLTATLYGTSIYIGYTNRAGLANGGTFTVSIDGVVYATVDTNVGQTGIVTVLVPSPAQFWPEAARFGGLAPGPHTVVLTVTSASGTVNIDWLGSNDGAGLVDWPQVFVGTTLRMSTAGYTASSNASFNVGSETASALFAAEVRSAAHGLAADGLHVWLVDTALAFNPSIAANLDADNIHPTDTGHARLAEAFLEAINGAHITPADRLRTARLRPMFDQDAATPGDTTINTPLGSVVMPISTTTLNLTNSHIQLTPRLSKIFLQISGGAALGADPRAQITANGQATITLGTAQAALCRINFEIK